MSLCFRRPVNLFIYDHPPVVLQHPRNQNKHKRKSWRTAGRVISPFPRFFFFHSLFARFLASFVRCARRSARSGSARLVDLGHQQLCGLNTVPSARSSLKAHTFAGWQASPSHAEVTNHTYPVISTPACANPTHPPPSCSETHAELSGNTTVMWRPSEKWCLRWFLLMYKCPRWYRYCLIKNADTSIV